MNDLRAAAQQLLGALDKSLYMNDYSGLEVSKHDQPDVTDAIENLRASLAEPQEPDSPERRCGGPGCDMRCCQPVQEPVGAVLVNRESREGVMFYSVDMIPDPSTLKDRFELVPVYTAPPQRPAEPIEPVAWLRVIDEAMVTHHLGVAAPTDDYETAKRKMNTLLSAAQDIGTYFAKQAEPVQEPQGCDHCDHPLYAATKCRVCGRVTEPTPPQRKPLAEWQINDLMADIDPEDRDSWSFRQGVYAAEKHHGVRK